ncbi:MAG: hypothetical protein L3J16_01960 [Anaerolineales bacterium]|nr:hypothetical protein [Anaerolineales bacterium]
MNTLAPHTSLKQPLTEVLVQTTQQLKQAGLQVEQTFDLHVARLAHTNCLCPHHGTDQCSCQMVVLLVRCEGEDPLTLILHGSDEATNLSVIDPYQRHSSQGVEEIVQKALMSENLKPVEFKYGSTNR